VCRPVRLTPVTNLRSEQRSRRRGARRECQRSSPRRQNAGHTSGQWPVHHPGSTPGSWRWSVLRTWLRPGVPRWSGDWTPPPRRHCGAADQIARYPHQTQTTASRNGARTPASSEEHATLTAAKPEKDPGWCHTHQVTMRWHEGNARGPGWFSHQLADGSYCKGK